MTIRVSFVFALLLLSSSFLRDVNWTWIQKSLKLPGKETMLGLLARMSTISVVGVLFLRQGWKQFVFSQKNPSKSVMAGEESELLVGIKNEGEPSVKAIVVHASVHLPYNHHMLVQNLPTQAFNNATVPPSAQATFPYILAVSKFLQAGTFDLVGYIVYEIEQHPYRSTFYNSTIEVTEAGALVSVESVFLFSLGVALLVLLGLWVRGQVECLSKKSKRAPKVEVGTGTTDASMDEWLQGTAYARSLSSKSKNKK